MDLNSASSWSRTRRTPPPPWRRSSRRSAPAWTWSACRTIRTSGGSLTRGRCWRTWREGPSASDSLPDVLNLPLRLPTMIAKSVASLDSLSGGRVELGIGAGGILGRGGGDGRPPPHAEGVRRRAGGGARDPAQLLVRRAVRPLRGPALPGRRSAPRPAPSPPSPDICRGLRAADAKADRPPRRTAGYRASAITTCTPRTQRRGTRRSTRQHAQPAAIPPRSNAR